MGETEPMTCISIFTRDKKKPPSPDNDGNAVPPRKGMRRSSSMGIFKAALGMLRTKSWSQLPVSDSKPDQVDVDSKVGEKGNVESISPMELQSSQLPPSHSPPKKVTLEIVPEPIPGEEQKVEATASPLSPVPFSTMPAVSDVSQNNSPCEGTAKEKRWHRGDDDGGDEKIDTKAEEFIAQFYEQMKLQSMNS
ncbi:hypothetical protein HRI_003556500 [Hibiscus trionum]|uniref:Uncharacterized protein n=1 Tax=Hibiscus trionum TaxID=183268 RepID=A0A9W7IPS7_HIBTR|nr:hypothetical protein HRI_003556500 [Hibiscus trionum]